MGDKKKKEVSEEMPTEQTAAERLALIESQRKVLLDKIKQEKADAIKSRKDARLQKNASLATDKEILKSITREIYKYNLMSKSAKAKSGIFVKITELVTQSQESSG